MSDFLVAQHAFLRFRARILLLFGPLYLLSAAALIAVNENEGRLVRWAIDAGLSVGDVLWLCRLLPAIIGGLCPMALFISQWHAIDFRQQHGLLSPWGARVRAYSWAAAAGALSLLIVHLTAGGPP